jgi:tetratricopeptide (TPR) repeat protein
MEARFFNGMALMALDEKASMLAEAGRSAEAIAELQKVFTYDLPKDHPVYEVRVRLVGKLARLLASTGRKDDAVKTIQDLLADVAAKTPSEAAAWFEAGKTYREVGKTDEALKAFDKAIALSDELSKLRWEPGPAPGANPRNQRPGGPGNRPRVLVPGSPA